MNQPRRSDVIELIDVRDADDPTFDWSSWSPSGEPAPVAAVGGRRARGRRWPLAAVVLVVALVVAAVTSGDHAPPGPSAEGRYVLDGAGLQPYDIGTPERSSDDGGFRIWAAGGPDRPFVVLQADTDATAPWVTLDADVRRVRGMPFIHQVGKDHSVTVVREYGSDDRVVMQATGFDDADVATLANGLTLLRAADRVVDVQVPDTTMARMGLREVVRRRWQDDALFGEVTSSVDYLDHLGDLITLRVADGDLDTQVRTLGYLAGAPPREHDGRWLGIPSGTGRPVVLWQQGGHVLSLEGPGDPSRLLAWSQIVRPMTDDEWTRTFASLHAEDLVGPAVRLAEGTGWTAGVERVRRGDTVTFRWRLVDLSRPDVVVTLPLHVRPNVMPFADRAVVGGATYVFVAMPSALQGQAAVTVGDGAPTALTMVRAFPDMPVLMGALRIDEPGAVRVLAPGTLGS